MAFSCPRGCSDFDFDIVRHTGVPGFQGGNANLGVRGAQVQADGAVLIVHELGHNLGLSHANAWMTGSPGVALRWADPGPTPGSSLVLAPLTGTPSVNGGTILPAGRTFADPLPRITVDGVGEVTESAGPQNLFTVTRTGSTAEPLTVLYRLGGTATAGRDYARPLIDRLTIPAGAHSAFLALTLFDDQLPEGDETITLDISDPVSDQRRDASGQPFTIYYPGWEYLEVDHLAQWVLTEPAYIPAARRR